MNNKVFINSIPKGGTHLVSKLVQELGFSGDRFRILGSGQMLSSKGPFQKLFKTIRGGAWLPLNDFVLAGVEMPMGFRSSWLRKQLDTVSQGEMLGGHVRYSDHFAYLLKQRSFKVIQVIRDLRDVAVSHAHFMGSRKSHPLFDHYQTLGNWDAQLTFSISGGPVPRVGYLESIGARAISLNGWLQRSDILIVRFEDLVGVQGGGNAEDQISAIRAIVSFLECDITTEALATIAASLFGGTQTFRKGMKNNWQSEFSRHHSSLFDEVAGDVLCQWGYRPG